MYLKIPSSEQEWKESAKKFKELWNFPHAIGSIDGKHIAIQCPKISGFLYYNYKGLFSVALLAICDPKYCFTFVYIGQYGSGNDGGVLKQSKIGFEYNELDIPKASKIARLEEELPYFLLGDEIFTHK